jgi:hypothetical protein
MYISKGDLMVYDHLQMGFHGKYGIYTGWWFGTFFIL